MKTTPKKPLKNPEVNSYYLRKEKDNMWVAVQITPDGNHVDLHVMDTLGIALNNLQVYAKQDVVAK